MPWGPLQTHIFSTTQLKKQAKFDDTVPTHTDIYFIFDALKASQKVLLSNKALIHWVLYDDRYHSSIQLVDTIKKDIDFTIEKLQNLQLTLNISLIKFKFLARLLPLSRHFSFNQLLATFIMIIKYKK